MGFITDMPRMAHTGINGTWKILDNQLVLDEDGTLYLVPRNFLTDNYTIPNWIAWAVGSGDDRDVCPSHFHDFGCWFHSMVKVHVTLDFLKEHNLVREYLCKDGKMRTICEDIPMQYLSVVPMKKSEVDNLFKRLMLATGHISEMSATILRIGVFFNLNWWLTNHVVNLENFYSGVNPEYLKR